MQKYLKKQSTDFFFKFRRMMYTDKWHGPFKNDMNRLGGTHTSPISNVKVAILYKCSGANSLKLYKRMRFIIK